MLLLKKYFVCDLLSFAAVNFNFTLSDNRSSGTIDLSWGFYSLYRLKTKEILLTYIKESALGEMCRVVGKINTRHE